jgi:hypothetical protein
VGSQSRPRQFANETALAQFRTLQDVERAGLPEIPMSATVNVDSPGAENPSLKLPEIIWMHMWRLAYDDHQTPSYASSISTRQHKSDKSPRPAHLVRRRYRRSKTFDRQGSGMQR